MPRIDFALHPAAVVGIVLALVAILVAFSQTIFSAFAAALTEDPNVTNRPASLDRLNHTENPRSEDHAAEEPEPFVPEPEKSLDERIDAMREEAHADADAKAEAEREESRTRTSEAR